MIRLLGISGSLRTASSNTALLHAASRVLPLGVALSVYDRLGDLPPFNPDLDGDAVPAAVSGFRAALHQTDAILMASPEYAHGVSGVLKNALDWVVGSGEIIGMPIALLNASARATIAHAALCDTLVTMSGHIVTDASVTIPLTHPAFDRDGNLNDQRLSAQLRSAIEVLADVARQRRCA